MASTVDSKLFYLTDRFGRQELAAIKSSEEFFCPGCGASLILKIGNIKTPHFAHKSLSECDSFSEPESSLHLQGKLLLHQFFHNKNHPVELEKYLPEIRQRADLLVGQKTAIEFQCSSIPAAEIASRSEGYKKIGIQPIWISGIAEPKIEFIQLIKFKAYERELLQQSLKNAFLLSFCPEDNKFYYSSNLFYISGNRWVGKVKALPAERQSFPFAVPKRLTRKEFGRMITLFSQARKQYIHNQFFAKRRVQNPFWRACYELKLDMKKLPETIGIPLYKAECIPHNAVLWQLQAIAAFKKGLPMRSLIDSGKLKLCDSANIVEVERLLNDYLDIHFSIERLERKLSALSDILYDNYCKNL